MATQVINQNSLYCPKCGLKNSSDSKNCRVCKVELHKNSTSLSETNLINSIPDFDKDRAVIEIEFPKKNLLVHFLLTFFSLGIYQAIWFIKNRELFNNLRSGLKLKSLPLANSILLMSIGIFSGLLFGFNSMFPLKFFWMPFGFYGLGYITLLSQSLKLQQIFNEHFEESINHVNLTVGKVILGQTFYIQSILNRIK